LTELLSVSGINPSYLAPACKRLGLSYERMGDDRGALQAYQASEGAASGFSTGVDSLMHEVWIDLRLGDDQEALRVLGLLQGVPKTVVAKSSYAEQLREMEALAGTGRAEEVWRAGRAWWSRWRELRSRLGCPPETLDEKDPAITDLRAFVDGLRASAQSGKRAEYLARFGVMLGAARWQPSMAAEVAAASTPVFGIAGDQAEPFRNLLIEVLEGPHPASIPNLRKRQLFLASNYLNAKRASEALKAADAFLSSGVVDEFVPAMHQVRGLAALDENLECAQAVDDLKGDLENPRSGTERAMAAAVLSRLYVRLGRDDDARALLKQELNDPAVVADQAGYSDLARQYSLLVDNTVPGIAGTSPTYGSESGDSVSDWIRSVRLDWYGYVEPASLSGMNLADETGLIAAPGSRFSDSEQVKFLLLAGQDGRLDSEQRRRALTAGVCRLILSAGSYPRMIELAGSVLKHPAFDDEIRLRAYWALLSSLAADGRTAEYANWRRNPLVDHFSPVMLGRLALLDAQASEDRSSAQGLEKSTQALIAGTRDAFGLQALKDQIRLLIRIGDLKAAQALYDSCASLSLDSDSSARADSFRLDLARLLGSAAAGNPVHEAMRGALLRLCAGVPAELPPEFRDARILEKLPRRPAEPSFEACLYLASRRLFERDDLSFWESVFSSYPSSGPGSAADVLGAGLAASGDDVLRYELILRFLSSADLDDPGVREATDRVLGRYRDRSSFPESAVAIGLYDIRSALRMGKEVSLETAYAKLGDPRAEAFALRDCLRSYTASSDRDALRRTLAGARSETLLAAGFIGSAIEAYRVLGMETELGTARGAAKRMITRDIEDSWVLGEASRADAALDLATALAEPGVLPGAWREDGCGVYGDVFLSQRAEVVDGFLSHDWKRVESASGLLNRLFPTSYDFYWYRGLALHNLGDDRGAALSIAKYVTHERDGLEYPEAQRLLAAIAPQAVNGEAAPR
jgi:hypothetical protein